MKSSWRIALFYAALFLGLGDVFAFLPVWYASRGLSTEWIGLALGAGAFGRVLAGPIVAAHAGHPAHLPRILRIAALAVFGIFLLHIPFSMPPILLVLGFALGVAYGPLIPLTDALALSKERRGELQYGPVRSAGSAAFVVGNLIAGFLIAKAGGESVLYLALVAALLMVLTAGFLPGFDGEDAAEVKDDKARHRLRDAMLFALRSDMAMVLLATFLIQLSHSVFYGFSAVLWSREGISGTIIGALFAWGVLFEVAIYSFSAKIRQRFSPLVILGIGGMAAVIRWLALSSEPGLHALIGWQILHGFSVAMTNLGIMAYLQAHTPERILPGMQAVNAGLNSSIALGVGFALAGVLVGHYAFGAYLFAAGVAFAGLLVVIVLALSLRNQAERG